MSLRDFIFHRASSRQAPQSDDSGEVTPNPSLGPAGPKSQPDTAGATPKGKVGSAPPGHVDTSALNAKVVQAVSFGNAETAQYLPDLVQAPPEVMATQTAGIAIQDAAAYMNAIMQIALAAQAVIAKKAAQGPVEAAEEVPAMLEIQKMVTAAVEVYGTVSKTAGTSAKTVITDVSAT